MREGREFCVVRSGGWKMCILGVVVAVVEEDDLVDAEDCEGARD